MEICCLEYIGKDITFFFFTQKPKFSRSPDKNKFWVFIYLHVHLLKSVLSILN